MNKKQLKAQQVAAENTAKLGDFLSRAGLVSTNATSYQRMQTSLNVYSGFAETSGAEGTLTLYKKAGSQ